MQTRTLLLCGAGVATLAAAYFAPPPGDEPVRPVERVAQASASLEASPSRAPAAKRSVDVLELRPRGDDGPALAIFPAPPAAPRAAPKAPPVAELPPPQPVPPPPPPAVPAPPQAPPLPFKAIGRYAGGGTASIFLQHNDQAFIARVGDVLLEQYRVERVADDGVELRFLPLNQLQTVEISLTAP